MDSFAHAETWWRQQLGLSSLRPTTITTNRGDDTQHTEDFWLANIQEFGTLHIANMVGFAQGRSQIPLSPAAILDPQGPALDEVQRLLADRVRQNLDGMIALRDQGPLEGNRGQLYQRYRRRLQVYFRWQHILNNPADLREYIQGMENFPNVVNGAWAHYLDRRAQDEAQGPQQAHGRQQAPGQLQSGPQGSSSGPIQGQQQPQQGPQRSGSLTDAILRQQERNRNRPTHPQGTCQNCGSLEHETRACPRGTYCYRIDNRITCPGDFPRCFVCTRKQQRITINRGPGQDSISFIHVSENCPHRNPSSYEAIQGVCRARLAGGVECRRRLSRCWNCGTPACPRQKNRGADCIGHLLNRCNMPRYDPTESIRQGQQPTGVFPGPLLPPREMAPPRSHQRQIEDFFERTDLRQRRMQAIQDIIDNRGDQDVTRRQERERELLVVRQMEEDLDRGFFDQRFSPEPGAHETGGAVEVQENDHRLAETLEEVRIGVWDTVENEILCVLCKIHQQGWMFIYLPCCAQPVHSNCFRRYVQTQWSSTNVLCPFCHRDKEEERLYVPSMNLIGTQLDQSEEYWEQRKAELLAQQDARREQAAINRGRSDQPTTSSAMLAADAAARAATDQGASTSSNRGNDQQEDQTDDESNGAGAKKPWYSAFWRGGPPANQ